MLENGKGHAFELSSVLVSLLIGQGYDAYVVSGYANVLLTQVESSRNYLRYECPYLLSEAPTDIFQTFQTKSRVTFYSTNLIDNVLYRLAEVLGWRS